MSKYSFICDDYEIFDIIMDATSIPTTMIVPGNTRVVYIDRQYYNADMRLGMNTHVQIRAQLRRDIPRCAFCVDYRNKIVKNSASIPDLLRRFCTQAVMALPIEIISQTGCMVAECTKPQRMGVRVFDEAVLIQKKLRIAIDGQWFNIQTWISIDLQNPLVTFVYKIASTAESDVEF